MKVFLLQYEGVSRQVINFDKSLVYLSKNVESRMKGQIRDILGV